MKVFDTDKTDRGTDRKRVYVSYGLDKEAKKQALRDFNADKARDNMYRETITPYKHKCHACSTASYIQYWLNFERATILRYGI